MIWHKVLLHGEDGCCPRNYVLLVLFFGWGMFSSPLLSDEVGLYRETWMPERRPNPRSLTLQAGSYYIPVGSHICHRGCAYTVLQTVQRHRVYSTVCGPLHYKEPLKSFKIRVGHCPGFGLPSLALLPWLCRKRREAIFTHTLQHYTRVPTSGTVGTPGNTSRRTDAGLMLFQRRRRWANNQPALFKRVAFSGVII